MDLLKKLLSLLFAAFLAYRSVALLKTLNVMVDNPPGIIGAILIGAVMNIYVTGVFAIPGFFFPSNKLLGSSYYAIKNPASLKNLYNKLGVEKFRELLIRFIWGKENNRKKYFDGTRTGFENFIYQSKQSEFGHLLPFIILVLISIWLLWKAYFLIALVTSIINVIFNFYPIVLQRFHRIRIEKVMKRYLKTS